MLLPITGADLVIGKKELTANKSLDRIRLSVTALAWQGPRQSALTGQLKR